MKDIKMKEPENRKDCNDIYCVDCKFYGGLIDEVCPIYAKFNSKNKDIDILKEKLAKYKKENDVLINNKHFIRTIYRNMCDDSNEVVYKINILTDKIRILEEKQ